MLDAAGNSWDILRIRRVFRGSDSINRETHPPTSLRHRNPTTIGHGDVLYSVVHGHRLSVLDLDSLAGSTNP